MAFAWNVQAGTLVRGDSTSEHDFGSVPMPMIVQSGKLLRLPPSTDVTAIGQVCVSIMRYRRLIVFVPIEGLFSLGMAPLHAENTVLQTVFKGNSGVAGYTVRPYVDSKYTHGNVP